MTLLNKDIDFMTIRFKKNPSFPNPNWRFLRIIMKNNMKSSTWINLSKLLSQINFETKIGAKIDMECESLKWLTDKQK